MGNNTGSDPRDMIKAGGELVMPIILMTALGWWGDKSFETHPWLFLGGFLIGTIVGFYNIYKLTHASEKDISESDQDK